MTLTRFLAALALVAGLGACAAPDITSRGAALSGADLMAFPIEGATIEGEVLIAQYDVRAVNVTVPRSLRVSEANLYYPLADVVWRGEPQGDRYAQVKAIFDQAMTHGTAGMKRGPAVTVDVEVARFHALTEKARYSVGGVHSIRFDLTVRDANTGAVIDGPRRVIADVLASGGSRAIEEDRRGLTQRVVIVHNLAHTILRELSILRPVEEDEQLVARLDTELNERLVSRLDTELRLTLAAVSMKNETD